MQQGEKQSYRWRTIMAEAEFVSFVHLGKFDSRVCSPHPPAWLYKRAPLWLSHSLLSGIRRRRTESRGRGIVPPESDMAIEAWFIEEGSEDQRLPNHRNPKEFVSLDHLADLGLLYWHFDPNSYEDDKSSRRFRRSRGYSYTDFLDLCPEKVDNYEQKLKNYYTEHIHGNEEIRYCLDGSGYFDIWGKDDCWIRLWLRPGDFIIVPAGLYHRFTLDTVNYIKLMRLFIGEPVWTSFNRPQEEHPARKKYIESLTDKSGVPLEAR